MHIINLAVFIALAFAVHKLAGNNATLSRRVLFGLIGGVFFGLALQLLYTVETDVLSETLKWTNVVAVAYVNLLRMMIMPLILIMMISSVVRMRELAILGRIGITVVGILIATTIIASLVGITMTLLFDLTAAGLTEGPRELARLDVLATRSENVEALAVTEMIAGFFSTNIFYDLTGARSTSIIAVVLFGILFGIATLQAMADDAERRTSILSAIDTLQTVIMKLVGLVMSLTPYGILALMTNVIAMSDPGDVLSLLNFVLASYLAITAMFFIHMALLRISGVSIRDYLNSVWPVLTFAFASRSSAATIPLNVEAQVTKLGVSPPVASLSATFGSTIGQNGCAGIYPSMLAVMIAPTMGIEVLDPGFILGLVAIVAISSFGVAGVGGGATYAALIVLPALGFPVTLAALLISIEPLIDMARTALNVNGAITAGVLTNRWVSRPAASTAAEA